MPPPAQPRQVHRRLATRLHAKLAANTLCLYLNYFTNRPLLALMDLALI